MLFVFSGISYLLSFLLLDTSIMNGNHAVVGWTEQVKKGDAVSMEVDLRSKEKNKRTVRFGVNGKVQKYCLTGLPENIRFGV